MTFPSSASFPSPDAFPTPAVPSPVSSFGMTLSDAQNELRGRGFDYLTAARMTIMLNDAKNSFEDVWEFPWLQRFYTGVAPLQLVDVKYILSVKLGQGYCGVSGTSELLGIDIRQLAQGSTDLMQPGNPDYWYTVGGIDDEMTLYVWPVAGVQLDIAYIAQTPELSEPTDRPLIPPRYRSIWIDLAVIQAYQDSDNYVAAQQLQADVNTRLNGVIERYETFNRQHSGFIATRGYSEDE